MNGAASAASSVYVLYYLRGKRPNGGEDLCIEGLSVGYGARNFADGLDAVYYVAQENYPVEFAEMEFGLEIEQFSVHCDSGGAGRYRGGCGIVRDVRVLLDEMTLGIRIDNCRYPAFGTNGGTSGMPGGVIINPGTAEERRIKPLSDGTVVKKGDLIRIITPGGGGWGSPLDRPQQDVLDDVLDGYVSIKQAKNQYGVVLSKEGLAIDFSETKKLRASRPRATEMFHRGEYYNAEDDRTPQNQ
jgi:N-methylhydantoinase B